MQEQLILVLSFMVVCLVSELQLELIFEVGYLLVVVAVISQLFAFIQPLAL